MKKAKTISQSAIPWCAHVWNPVVGCNGGCSYCYARRYMKRFLAKKFFEAEKEYYKGDVFPAEVLEKEYEMMKRFEVVYLAAQLNKNFPEKSSIIFANPLSDIAYWDDEGFFNRVMNRITANSLFYRSFNWSDSQGHIFIFLTKKWDTYKKFINIPDNLFCGLTLADPYAEADIDELIKITTWLKDRNFRVLWNLEPMSILTFDHFFACIQQKINLGNFSNEQWPEWIIWGPRTPNRIVLTPENIQGLPLDDKYRLFVKGVKYHNDVSKLYSLTNPVDESGEIWEHCPSLEQMPPDLQAIMDSWKGKAK